MTQPAAYVETEVRGDQIIVSITGELDVFNAATVAGQIESAVPTEAHAAVIDLTAVGFLDLTAIRKLFGLATRLGERRQAMVIVAPRGSTVWRTLQLVEFGRAADMHATLEAALSALDDVAEGESGSDAPEPESHLPPK